MKYDAQGMFMHESHDILCTSAYLHKEKVGYNGRQDRHFVCNIYPAANIICFQKHLVDKQQSANRPATLAKIKWHMFATYKEETLRGQEYKYLLIVAVLTLYAM